MTVDFLICGTQKGGTSALDAYCRQHPDLLLPAEKEQHFFDNENLFTGLEADYSLYHRNFPAAEPGKLRGESTPVYMYWPDAPARIHRYHPGIKLIVLLRDPVDRAYSHWQMETSRGYENLSFSEAIRQEEQRLAGSNDSMNYNRRVYSYIDRGHYLQQLDVLWSLFGKQQVLVLLSEQLRSNRDEVLGKVSAFLGIAPFDAVTDQTVNSQDYTASMNSDDRAYLRDLFSAEIATLASAIGQDLAHWR